MRRRVLRWVAATAIVATFVVRAAVDLTGNSATFDEPEYITAGYSYVVTHEIQLETWHPPLSFLLAGLAVRARFDLPFAPDPKLIASKAARRIGRDFIYGDDRDAAAIIHTARIPSLVLGVLTVLLIGAWAFQLWGERAGWWALALAAFDPSLIANASLVTPDIGLTFFMLLAMYATWRYLRAPSAARWIAICGATLLAILMKHIGFLLAPAIAATLVEAVVTADAPRRRQILRAVAATVAGLVAVAIVATLVGLPVVGDLLGAVRGRFVHMDWFPISYLGGEVGHGYWYYYLVVLALKMPLGTLVLAAVSVIRARSGTQLTRASAVILAVPAVCVIAVVSWMRIDIGIRLILPAIPFLILLAARAATLPGRWRWVASGALAATLASSAATPTGTLAYFNEAAVLSGGGEYWLSDSNLDWGQDLDRLVTYLRETKAPPVYLAYFGGGSPTHAGLRHATLPTDAWFPITGDDYLDSSELEAPCRADRQLIAISLYCQQGIIDKRQDRYRFLSKLTPIAQIGASIRVYDVTADLDSHIYLAAMFGYDNPAGACELERAYAIEPRMRRHPRP